MQQPQLHVWPPEVLASAADANRRTQQTDALALVECGATAASERPVSVHHVRMQLALQTGALTRSDVLTAAEVAASLRIPTSTVYELARRGRLPGHRVGRAWRFIRPEIEQWLQAS